MSEYNYTGKQLAELFASDLRQQDFDVRSVGELVHFTYQGEDYYAFLRSISYAGNPHPQNRYRLKCLSVHIWKHTKKTAVYSCL